MSYRTLEVELENGFVRPFGEDSLPVKARGLLTILEQSSSIAPASPTRTLGEAVRGLGILGRGDIDDLSVNKAHLSDFGQ